MEQDWIVAYIVDFAVFLKRGWDLCFALSIFFSGLLPSQLGQEKRTRWFART